MKTLNNVYRASAVNASLEIKKAYFEPPYSIKSVRNLSMISLRLTEQIYIHKGLREIRKNYDNQLQLWITIPQFSHTGNVDLLLRRKMKDILSKT